ncbi:type II toxin-antitoxin system PemK/MazF family toxin [Oerskovia turbata]
MAQNKWLSLLLDVARAIFGGSSRSDAGSDASRRPSGPTTSPTPRGVAPRPPTRATSSGSRAPQPGPRSSAPATKSAHERGRGPQPGAYPGDFTGRVRAEYAPHLDGDPDPGEIVWTWVPFEEDHSQGKDRPVLLVGRDGRWLLAVMLTSKDHSRDGADEARWGRHWLDIGSGPWDARGRDSEVRLDRVIRVDPGAVRREGAVMDRATFDQVVREMGRI